MTGTGPSHRVCVFDSGLGGLSLARELRLQAPDIDIIYCADNAGFPYGGLSEPEVSMRTVKVIEVIVETQKPDAIVIACNTASTVALDALRARFSLPIVGTVPAIKPATEITKTGMISVLATPGTIKRNYTHNLVDEFASDCQVGLVACRNLAKYAENHLSGYAVGLEKISIEIAPAFVEFEGRRTDTIVLGCTHYPLVTDMLVRAAPWPVWFIDPSAAIVRHLLDILSYPGASPKAPKPRNTACLTNSIGVDPAFSALFLREGFQDLTILSV